MVSRGADRFRKRRAASFPRPLYLLMKLAEFRRLGIEQTEAFFRRNIVLAGIDVVSQHADQHERLDKDRMDDRPHDDPDERRKSDGQRFGIGEDLTDPVRLVGKVFRHPRRQRLIERLTFQNQIGNDAEYAADPEQGDKSHAEHAAHVLCKRLAVLEKQHRAFARRSCGLDLLAIEDPAEAAVAKIIDDRLHDGAHRAADRAAGIAADAFAELRDAAADLIEDPSDHAGDGKERGNGRKAFLDNLLTLPDDVVGQFSFADAAGHHGDLSGFQRIRNEPRDEDQRNDADHRADQQTDRSVLRVFFTEEIPKRSRAEKQHDRNDIPEHTAQGEADRFFVDLFVVHNASKSLSVYSEQSRAFHGISALQHVEESLAGSAFPLS